MTDDVRTDANGLGLAAIQQEAATGGKKPVRNPLLNLRISEIYRLAHRANAQGGIDVDEAQQYVCGIES
ncbi:MAG: hypothetical protein H6861_07070 [Rhodospirillales bacterium]|nr:hypothetical protein [Rhodospirillales bacterium]